MLLLLGIAFAYAQTPIAKAQISRALSDSLSEPPNRTEISDLRGLLPFEVRIGRVSLADEEGEWLRVEEAELELAPTDLLAGRLRATRVGARRVTLERLPDTGDEPAPTAASSLPTLPEGMPPLIMDRLYVEAIELGPAILGEAARFRLEGSLRTDGDGRQFDAALELRRTDREGTEAGLRAAFDPTAATLSLELRARDDGRLAGLLTGRPEAGPVALAVIGRGPLDDFSARLDLRAENLARLEAELVFAKGATPRLLLDGRFLPAPGVLPAAYASLVGDGATIAFELVQPDPQRITISRLAVRSGLLEIEGRGSLALADNRIDGELTARLDDLSKLSPLLGTELAGSLSLTARPGTGGNGPAVEVVIAGRGLRYAALEGDELSGRLRIAPLAPLDRPFLGLAAEGRVVLRDVARDGETIAALDGSSVAFGGRWRRDGAIEIERLALDAPALALRTEGRLDLAAGGGDLRMTAETRDPGALLALAMPEDPLARALSGRLDATLDLILAEGFARLDGKLAVEGGDLAGLPDATAPLIGPAPRLRADLLVRPDRPFAIRDLEVEAAAFRLTGAAAVSGPARRLAGDLRLALPDLAALSSLAGRGLAGGGEAEISFGGSLAAPAATVEVRLAPLTVEGYRLDRAVFDLVADNLLGSPEGEFRVAGNRGDQRLALAGRFALDDGRLALRSTTLEGPETSGTLSLQLDLETLLAEGEISLTVADLAALDGWHGQPLAGRLDASLRLDRRENAQDVRFALTAAGIRSPFGDVETLEIGAGATDLLGGGRLEGTIALADLRRSDVLVEAGRFRFAGPLSDLAISVDATGTAGDPFDLAAEARLALAGKRRELTLTALEGLLSGQKVRLRSPARAVLEDGILEIDELDLFVGEGTIRGELRQGAGYRWARLEGGGLPLLLFGRFADLPVRGTVAFGFELETGRGAPRAELRARIERLRARDLLGGEYPPVALDLAAELRDGRLELRADSSLGGDGGSRLALRMPVAWRELPPDVPPPPDTPLEGEVDVRAELGILATLLGLRDQYVTGRGELALRLSGTLAAPRLTGEMRIRDGRLEDGISGAVLRDIVAELRAEGDRVRIARFEARDADRGRIAVTGELRFAELGRLAYGLDLDAREFLFWNGPLATLRGGGRLRLAGDTGGARLVGEVTLDRGEIRVLARSSAVIPEVAVIERGNGRSPEPSAEAAVPVPGEGFPLAVEVRVAIPGRLFARGGGLDSEWSGALRIAGTVPAVGVVGTIEAERALLDLLGRRFQLREGRIIFTGAIPPEPRIELVAHAESPDIIALFHVTGSLYDPTLLLESEPPLPRDEVLARLLFGEDAGRLEPIEALQVAAIIAEMEGGGFDILAELRDLTTLDTLRLSSGRDSATAIDNGDPTAADSYLAAGKYLTDEIYVEVEQSVSGEQTAVRAEIDLGAGVMASSVVDEAGGGVELEWRYDF